MAELARVNPTVDRETAAIPSAIADYAMRMAPWLDALPSVSDMKLQAVLSGERRGRPLIQLIPQPAAGSCRRLSV